MPDGQDGTFTLVVALVFLALASPLALLAARLLTRDEGRDDE